MTTRGKSEITRLKPLSDLILITNFHPSIHFPSFHFFFFLILDLPDATVNSRRASYCVIVYYIV